MNEIIELLKDKITEAENCEEIDISEEYLKGYKNGLDMAITIINEIRGSLKMNKYESVFLIKGRINEEEAGKEFEKIAKDFSLCVNIVGTDFKGKRKLAYPINKNTQGYFCVINFETKNNAGEIAELETELKYNDNVLKFIIVKVED